MKAIDTESNDYSGYINSAVSHCVSQMHENDKKKAQMRKRGTPTLHQRKRPRSPEKRTRSKTRMNLEWMESTRDSAV